MGSAGAVVTTRSPRERDRGRTGSPAGSSLSSGTSSMTRVPPRGPGPTARRPPRRRARSRMLRRPWWPLLGRRRPGARSRSRRRSPTRSSSSGANTRTTCTRQAPAWRAVFESASRRICSRCSPGLLGQRPGGAEALDAEAHVAAGLLGEAPGQVAEAGRDALGRGGRLGERRGCSRGCRRWPRSGRRPPRAPRDRTEGSSQRIATDSRWRPGRVDRLDRAVVQVAPEPGALLGDRAGPVEGLELLLGLDVEDLEQLHREHAEGEAGDGPHHLERQAREVEPALGVADPARA